MASSDDRDLVRTRLDAIARSAGGAEDDPDDTARHFGDTAEHFRETAEQYDDERDRPSTRLSDRLAAARWGTGRRGTAALAGVGVLAALVAMVVVWRDRPVPEPVPPLPSVEIVAATATASGVRTEPDDKPAELVVSVVGLVVRPGLVRLEPGARVADALDAAGGAAEGADLVGLNLARRVADGDQIVVGVSPPQPIPLGSTVSGVGAADGGGNPGQSPSAGPGKIDLNAADETALDALPGVGPVTASAIVAWRNTNGPFADVEQLGEVDGIGPARLARLRELVTV